MPIFVCTLTYTHRYQLNFYMKKMLNFIKQNGVGIIGGLIFVAIFLLDLGLYFFPANRQSPNPIPTPSITATPVISYTPAPEPTVTPEPTLEPTPELTQGKNTTSSPAYTKAVADLQKAVDKLSKSSSVKYQVTGSDGDEIMYNSLYYVDEKNAKFKADITFDGMDREEMLD